MAWLCLFKRERNEPLRIQNWPKAVEGDMRLHRLAEDDVQGASALPCVRAAEVLGV